MHDRARTDKRAMGLSSSALMAEERGARHQQRRLPGEEVLAPTCNPPSDLAGPVGRRCLASCQLPRRAGEISEEQYSVRLEMLKRENTTVEFISVDKGYAPSRTKVADQGSPEGVAGQKQEGREGEGKQGPDYKPKVATWGVFPRPKNISTSFGGGRNIAPG